jgi:hypothetical protein
VTTTCVECDEPFEELDRVVEMAGDYAHQECTKTFVWWAHVPWSKSLDALAEPEDQ